MNRGYVNPPISAIFGPNPSVRCYFRPNPDPHYMYVKTYCDIGLLGIKGYFDVCFCHLIPLEKET